MSADVLLSVTVTVKNKRLPRVNGESNGMARHHTTRPLRRQGLVRYYWHSSIESDDVFGSFCDLTQKWEFQR